VGIRNLSGNVEPVSEHRTCQGIWNLLGEYGTCQGIWNLLRNMETIRNTELVRGIWKLSGIRNLLGEYGNCRE
jgi:hypothetical protein